MTLNAAVFLARSAGGEKSAVLAARREEFTVPMTIMRHTPLNCCSSFSSSIRPGRVGKLKNEQKRKCPTGTVMLTLFGLRSVMSFSMPCF
jgi:hypothetical protein